MTSIGDDLAQQTEELLALEAIYGDESCTVDHQEHCCEVIFELKVEESTVLTTDPH